MIASLPMYDRDELRAATDRFWTLIRNHLGFGPVSLSRGTDLWATWTAPDLVLSQTCGLPFRLHLAPRVTLVGTPDYGLDGCEPGEYRSVLVVRKQDARRDAAQFAQAIFAYNDPVSQSGWAAATCWAGKHAFSIRSATCTGSHWASAVSVVKGCADIAAIDAHSWRLITRFDDFASDLRILDETAPTPALPFITAHGNNADAVFQACSQAIQDLSGDDRAALGLCGMVRLPASAYLALQVPPEPPG